MTAEMIGFTTFSRSEWAHLRSNSPLTLTEMDLENLRGISDPVSLDDIVDTFLPLSRLLNLHVAAAQNLARVKDAFLGRPGAQPPYIIGLAGSVAVGKSTFGRILQMLLSRWPDHPNVELVTTDGFLYPTSLLKSRNLMNRKGFPESYDLPKLIDFLKKIKENKTSVSAPVYSHVFYDIVPNKNHVVKNPDILILEGINILQVSKTSSILVSDFCNFSIFLDADERHIMEWYIERFLLLQKTSFRSPLSYFHHYSHLSEADARRAAEKIWEDINAKNLKENIIPTKYRADIIMKKSQNHKIETIFLKKI